MDEYEVERMKDILNIQHGLDKIKDDLIEVQMMLYEYTIKYPLTTDEGELTEDAVISTRNRNLVYYLLQNFASDMRVACEALKNVRVERK